MPRMCIEVCSTRAKEVVKVLLHKMSATDGKCEGMLVYTRNEWIGTEYAALE